MISHMNVPEHLEHKEKTLSKDAVQQEWVSYPGAEKFSKPSHVVGVDAIARANLENMFFSTRRMESRLEF